MAAQEIEGGLLMETKELVLKYADDMAAVRRHIHQHPELSHQEFATTALIKEKLAEYGVEIAEIGLETGVVGILRGGKPGKTVAIREDIDALPMAELTGLPFASEVEESATPAAMIFIPQRFYTAPECCPKSRTNWQEMWFSCSSRPRRTAPAPNIW